MFRQLLNADYDIYRMLWSQGVRLGEREILTQGNTPVETDHLAKLGR